MTELEAMTASDWMLLEIEHADTPMHTLKLVVVSGTARGRPVTLEEVATVVPPYLELSARFSSRVERRDGRWLWVRDRPVDITRHLAEHHLDSPDGFDALLTELNQEHLDRALPLWRINLVHGLANGDQAIVVQVHHALMDGSSALNVFDRVTNLEPGVPAPVPTVAELDGLQPREPLPRRLAEVARAFVDVRRNAREFGPAEHVPTGMAKRSQFNVRSRGGRTSAVSELPLADFREIADLTGTHLNGALHGVLALALRKQMIADGNTPTSPLVGTFGVIEDRSLERYAGNHLATARYRFHVEDGDPVRALRRTAESCAQTVRLRRARGFHFQNVAAEFGRIIPPLRNRFVHLWPLTPMHLITAYVTGPQEQRWLGDVEVRSWMSVTVVVELVNLTVMAYTYNGKVSLGVNATPESLPDPAGFLRLCGEALEEMLEAAQAAAG